MKIKRLLTMALAVTVIACFFAPAVAAAGLPGDLEDGWIWKAATDTSATNGQITEKSSTMGGWMTTTWGTPETNGGNLRCVYHQAADNNNGALCEYTFTGTQVIWYARVSWSSGSYTVLVKDDNGNTVDGIGTDICLRADQHGNAEFSDYPAFTSIELPYGTYTLSIEPIWQGPNPTGQLEISGFAYTDFVPETYNIDVSAVGKGKVEGAYYDGAFSTDGGTFPLEYDPADPSADDIALTFIPESGYYLKDVTVNTVSKLGDVVGDTLTIDKTDILSSQAIVATFVPKLPDSGEGWTWVGHDVIGTGLGEIEYGNDYGPWEVVNNAASYGGTVRRINCDQGTHSGDYCEFKFLGTGVKWYAIYGADGATVKVELDGNEVASKSVDRWSTDNDYSGVENPGMVWGITDLDYGEHTIRLSGTGGYYIYVTGFEYYDPGTPAGDPIITTSDSSVTQVNDSFTTDKGEVTGQTSIIAYSTVGNLNETLYTLLGYGVRVYDADNNYVDCQSQTLLSIDNKFGIRVYGSALKVGETYTIVAYVKYHDIGADTDGEATSTQYVTITAP